MINIGILGLGYVGTALKEGFKSFCSIETYDLVPNLSSCNSIEKLISKVDIVFICVPTPMNEDGSCNIDIIKSIIKEIATCNNSNNKIIVIKSTVPPGTTSSLSDQYPNLDIFFNPEFLTEANFIEDFKNQDRIILGGSKKSISILKELYNKVFSNATIIETESTIAEMVKYLANTFLATKVSFANEMKMICDKLNIDYNKVKEYAIYDDRLGQSHWSVPGPDGKLGFGGSCFPKDINALIKTASELSLDTKILKSVWDTNLNVRPEKDWEKLKGRAISDNNE